MKLPFSGHWHHDETFLRVGGKKAYALDTIDAVTKFVPAVTVTRENDRSAATKHLLSIRRRPGDPIKSLVMDGTAKLGTLLKTRYFKHVQRGQCNMHFKWRIGRKLKRLAGIGESSKKELPEKYHTLRQRFYDVFDSHDETQAYIALERLRPLLERINKRYLTTLFNDIEAKLPQIIAWQRDPDIAPTNNKCENFHQRLQYHTSFKTRARLISGAQCIADFRVFNHNFQRFTTYSDVVSSKDRKDRGYCKMLLRISTLEQFFSIRTLLLIILIGVLLTAFVVFIYRSRSVKNVPARRLDISYALFGLAYAMTRIFFLLSDYESAIHSGTFTQLSSIWVVSAYSVSFISLIFMFFNIEKNILGRKPILTIVAFIDSITSSVALVMTILGVGINLSYATVSQKIASYTMYITGPIFILGVVFLYLILIKNTTGLVKKKAIISCLGLAIFSAGLLLDMDLLSSLGFDAIRLNLVPILIMAGVLIFFLTRMDTTIVEYYQAKRICLVHRGVIKGKMYMCPECAIFYCISCKDAIAKAENICWICGSILDRSLELDLKFKAGDKIFNAFSNIKMELKQETDLATFNSLLDIANVVIQLSKDNLLPMELQVLVGNETGLVADNDQGKKKGKTDQSNDPMQ